MDDYQSSAMAKQALPSEPVNAVYSGRQSTNRGHHASRSQAFNSHTGPRLGPPLPVDKYSNMFEKVECAIAFGTSIDCVWNIFELGLKKAVELFVPVVLQDLSV
ncbi:hypothetical protein EB796_022225 [Bugula neritina]|uniref:Uncharacterized protein n=1 Tax=Bugula neritina TaxID=10212 RepID=A0A7J7J043_BUGNE|nr:hypothetical protein EB796_022225 [Bugula neritina]